MNDDYKMNEVPVDNTPKQELPNEPAMASDPMYEAPMDPTGVAGGVAATAVKTGIGAVSKKVLALIICMAIALVGAVGAILVLNSPAMIANRALGNVVDDFLAREEIDYFLTLFSEGSIDLSVNGEIEDGELDVHVKYYFDAKNESVMADDFSVKFTCDDVSQKLTGSIYADGNKLYVTNDEILNGTYGLERGTLESKLKKSIFAPGSDSEYELPEEIYNALLAVCKFGDGDLPEKLEKDLTETAERYSNQLKRWLKKYAEFKTVSQEVDLADGETKANVTYIIITPETVCNIVEDFYEYLKDDDDLRDLVVDYYEELAELFEMADLFDEDMDIEEIYDDAIDSLGDAIEMMLDGVEDEDEDSFIAICMATPKMSAKLMKLWVISGEDVKDFDDEDEVDEAFSIDFGKSGVKKTSQIVIEVAGEKVKYTVDKETKGVVEYKLQAGDDFKFTLKLDEKEEKFKAQVTVTEYSYWGNSKVSYAIEGKYTTGKGASTLELKKIKVNGETMDDLGVSVKVTFKQEDKMPKPESKITSVLDIDEEMIEDIIDSAEEWAEVFYDIGY